jgi:hypothetical protein
MLTVSQSLYRINYRIYNDAVDLDIYRATGASLQRSFSICTFTQ